ncbi:MAG: hypothetical protein ACK4NR_11775 [Micavibrio sp.]
MKQTIHTILLTCGCALLLTGCVSREQANTQLAKGCEAGVNALLPEGRTISKIVDKKVSPSPEGANMRHVLIKTIETDGFFEEEKDFECLFEESFGILNMNYTASVYQVRTGERIIGKSGNEIMGSAEDFLKLTDAIRKAMYE